MYFFTGKVVVSNFRHCSLGCDAYDMYAIHFTGQFNLRMSIAYVLSEYAWILKPLKVQRFCASPAARLSYCSMMIREDPMFAP